MTVQIDRGVVGDSPDEPRTLGVARDTPDLIFRRSAYTVGTVVLVITGAIGLFLGIQFVKTFHQYGFSFFTQTQFSFQKNIIGIGQVLIGTIEVAMIALVISFPLMLMLALYISEFAPSWIKSTLVTLVDLMAAVPSVIYAAWGYFLIMPHALYVGRFVNEYFGWIPIFRVDTNPHAATISPSAYDQSPAIAGLIVSMMVIPIGCAVMRGVFAQAPSGEREGAYALGATRWGMIRAVVIPFGRGGIVGGTMLALGRALGETVAVYLILSFSTDFRFEPLQAGGVTTASLIANFFGDANNIQLSALLAAGFVLFLITLVVNTLAAMIVNRSRSGAETN